MTDTDDKILVKYEGNADPNNATAAITFLSDPDRPDIVIGGQGELTEEEFARLQGLGYRLAYVEDDLKGLDKDALQKLAIEEGVETKDAEGKDLKVADLKVAIRENRAATQSPAVEELPPTATVGTGGVPPTTSGAGSAAGPGGAAGSGGAGGGPASTTGTGGGA